MMIKAGTYNIQTSSAFSALRAFLKKGKYSKYFVICDGNTLSNCLAILLTNVPELSAAEIIETESGEENKTLEICAGIWQSMIEQETSRDALVVNLGGGVICDLGGFCASVFKRGVSFIHIPTTLLAMCDASVGGKTGIDMLNVKNVIGSFSFPSAVFVDKVFLQTLPERHFYNGLAEVFKIALVSDGALFNYLEKHQGRADVQKLIDKSISLKCKIVKADPFDKGRRRVLNFGHSIGHAIESLSMQKGHDVLHGEAVIVGMIMESHIAMQKKMLSEKELIRIVSLFLGFYEKLDFEFTENEILQFLTQDKKNRKGKFLFSLITRAGAAKWDMKVKPAEIRKAVSFYHSLEYAEA
jgi:3-dehydroquinate synthase